MFEDFKITVFQTVASQGSFTKAASVLGISQPAVSQNVAELEKISGIKLFKREKGAVTLTGQGRILLSYASRIRSLGMSTDRLFTPLPPAAVRIHTSDEIWNCLRKGVLADFAALHPDISFRRTLIQEADMSLTLVPSPSLYAAPGAISRIRASISPIQRQTDCIAPVLEKTISFDLCFTATETFSESPVCHLLKEMLTDSISI